MEALGILTIRDRIVFARSKADDLRSRIKAKREASQGIMRWRQEIKNSLSKIQRSFSLGWIGVWETLYEKDPHTKIHVNMAYLMDLWQDLSSFLLGLRQSILNLEKILMFWERVLYLLLVCSLVSEFPNSLRPPCTTMPWTAWPALVVLWGVCWMFYGPLDSGWEVGQFEDESFDSQYLGDSFTLFSFNIRAYLVLGLDFNLPDFDCDTPKSETHHLGFVDFEEQEQQPIPTSTDDFRIVTSKSSLPNSSATNPQDDIGLSDSIGGFRTTTANPYQPVNATQDVAEARQLETAEANTLATGTVSSFVHGQHLDGAYRGTGDGLGTKSPRNSRHSQIEKYYCPYPDCSRSRQGSGFSRKDHLDQHLRGPHKQSSVSRVRAKRAAVSSSRNPAAASLSVQALSPLKKRKRGGDGELDTHSLNELEGEHAGELAEKRRLRLLAEQENQRLRQKLEKYEERMEKYEERLDRMMTLFGQQKGEEPKGR